MRIVAAPQEYKGTLTAEAAAQAMAEGVRRALPEAEVEVIPMADGGPGTVRAIVAARNGELRTARVTGPLHSHVQAEWGILPDGTAVIEMAAAAGLVLVPEGERDPRSTTTFGVGELIAAALDAGSRSIIVGLGGSATNDGGSGMAVALGVVFSDLQFAQLPGTGAAMASLERIDVSGLDPRLRETRVIGATDVRNPLVGPDGASIVYGPQKGATPEHARWLDDAMRRYANVIERDIGISVADVPGAGSAGGLGAGLIAFLRADIRPGVDIVAEVVGLADRVRGADLVLTGEGRLDGQTQWGKTVAGVASVAAAEGVPVIVVPGSLGEGWESVRPLVLAIEPVGADAGADSAETLATSVEDVVRRWTANR